MLNSVKVGIIGTGVWGENVIRAYQQNPFAQVVAVADFKTERAQQMARQYGIPKVYSDYREMIEKEDLDIGSVATPDYAHREPAVACLEAGLNVLVEKPTATNMDDCMAIAEAAEKSNKKFMTNYFLRWVPQFSDARLAMENGELGDIIEGYARIDDPITVPKNMLRWSKDSSPLFFVMIHNIDAVRWIIGAEAVEVYAKAQNIKLRSEGYETPDAVQAMVTFDNGATVLFDSNWVLPRTFISINDHFLRFVGTEGTAYINMTEQGLKVYRPEFKETFEHINRGTAIINSQFGNTVGCVARSVGHFVDCVLHNKQPVVTIKDAVQPTRIACAIQESLDTGKLVTL